MARASRLLWTLASGMFWTLLCHHGVGGYVRVQQAAVAVAQWGQDVILPCNFTHSPEEEVGAKPILYWERFRATLERLWPPDAPYEGRVQLLEQDQSSQNKSLLLRRVRWEDAGVLKCMMSYDQHQGQEDHRKRGNGTLLALHGSISLKISYELHELSCAVNVSSTLGFTLQLSHIGMTQVLARTQSSSVPPPVLLSGTVPLQSTGVYECQLLLNSAVLLRKCNHLPPDLSQKTKVELLPAEPWILYGVFLLTHCFTLIVISTAIVLIGSR